MNTINNKFSFRRLWAVMKLDDSINKIGRSALLFSILFFADQLLNLRSQCERIERGMTASFVDYCDSISVYFWVTLVVFLLGFAFDFASPVRGKKKAVSYLPIPALAKEKFLSRFLYSTIGVVVAFLVSLLVVDVLCMALKPLLGVLPSEFYGLSLPHILGKFNWALSHWYTMGIEGTWAPTDGYIVLSAYGEYAGYAFAAYCVLSIVWMHSLVLLSGNVWGERPWLNVLLVVLVLALFFGVLWGGFMSLFRPVLLPMVENQLYAFIGFAVIDILLMCLVVFNWWLSYRLFSRKQVVPVSRVNFFKNRKEATV